MGWPRLVVAGTAFPAVPQELARALPGISVEAVEPAALRSADREAEVIIPTMGRALLGRTAGIVGLGGIGQALAARLRPFGMRLLAVKRVPDPALAAQLGLDWLGGPAELPRRSRWTPARRCWRAPRSSPRRTSRE